jgi:hypothetical protein
MTPTQARMHAVLSDGLAHTVEELIACLADELGDRTNVQPHLTHLRKKLPMGESIACIINGRTYYQLVRRVNRE